jgi:lactate dehydrogenase-like 2-hydroxyacid dehydrogenase
MRLRAWSVDSTWLGGVRLRGVEVCELQGFDIHGKVIGIVGTGNIGRIAAK